MSKPEWPAWWEWELELTSHLRKRMMDRSFTEVDLRHMLEVAEGFAPDLVPGRWIIETRHRRQQWAIIVEPDARRRLLVVITAYPSEPSP